MKKKSNMICIDQTPVEKALAVEYVNGFGFQADDSTLTLAFISTKQELGKRTVVHPLDELTKQLRETTASLTVSIEMYLGRKIVEIHWKEWALIPLVLQTLLNLGYRVRLQMNGAPAFEPDEHFDFDAIEAKIVARLRSEKETCGQWSDVYTVERQPHVFLKHYNWHTLAGKALCTDMRAELKPEKPVAVKLDRYAWPWFNTACAENGILYHGGWSAFVPSGAAVDIPIPIAKAAESTTAPPDAAVATPIRLGTSIPSKIRAISTSQTEKPDTQHK